jgi:HEPN domain-containing protein
VEFIANPKKSIDSGDERAMELYAKYKMYMPTFEAIKGKDVEDLLGFIHKFSEGEKKNQNNRPGGMLDPIPKKIPEAELALVIEEFLTCLKRALGCLRA